MLQQKTLYIATVFFNPYQFNSRIRLYNEFKRYMSHHSNVKLFTVEIAFADHPFIVTDASDEWCLQLRANDEMWYKENGLNEGFKKILQLAPDAKYIAWVDADIKFSNPHWAEDTITALNHHKVVQMFAEAQSLDPQHHSQWKTPGIFYNFFHNIGYHQRPQLGLQYTKGGHPGLAWAARRDTLDKLGGLLDFCIHGSGDTHMANALMGNVFHNLGKECSASFKEALEEWASRCDQYVKVNIGYVNGIAQHYWHGRPQQRGYEKRWQIVCFHKFDPYTDIYKGLNGLYRFSGHKPHLAYDLIRSIRSRNEDSIDVK